MGHLQEILSSVGLRIDANGNSCSLWEMVAWLEPVKEFLNENDSNTLQEIQASLGF